MTEAINSEDALSSASINGFHMLIISTGTSEINEAEDLFSVGHLIFSVSNCSQERTSMPL